MKALRIALYAALVVGWIGLAWLLWGSVVPDGLALPHVDVDTVFGKALVDRAQRYERFLLVLWVLGVVVTVGTLAIYARYGDRFTEESAAGPLGTGMLLGMLGLAILWLTGERLRAGQHRHHGPGVGELLGEELQRGLRQGDLLAERLTERAA